MYKPGQEENGDADEEASFIALTQEKSPEYHEALDISDDIDNSDNVEDIPATRSRWHPLKSRDGRKEGEFVNVAPWQTYNISYPLLDSVSEALLVSSSAMFGGQP